jgi:hypothetical protein
MSARRTCRPIRFPLRLQALEGRIAPATFTVTNNNNSGSGSLRQAVTDANNHSGADLINFSSFFNTPRTITLSSTIGITAAVTIDGPGAANVTISGNDAVRIFNTQSAPAGSAISLMDLTLKSGRILANSSDYGAAVGAADETISLTRCIFTSNWAYDGGAISVSSGGSLSATECVFASNTASFGGGAIFFGGSGSLIAMACEFDSNSSSAGGAVWVTGGGSLTTSDCRFRSNTAGNGGAILSGGAGGPTSLTRCEITGNVAVSGGGLAAYGSLLLESSTVSGNSAVGAYGSYGYYPGDGGGIFAPAGTATTIRNSTISGNSAGGSAGILAATLTVQNSTIVGNTAVFWAGIAGGIAASSVMLESSIVANNSAPSAPDISATTVNAKTSSIFNRSGIDTFTDLGGNRPAGEDPRLGPLQDNGGPNPTHLLLPGSPCLDTGSNPANLTTDQRGPGFPRVLSGAPDMGAVEGVDVHPRATVVNLPPIVTVPGGTSYTVVIRYDDDVGIDLTTIDLNDIRVTGPAYATPQAPTALSISGSGTVVTVTYTVPAPGGAFDFTDYGAYSVAMVANQVGDSDSPAHHFVAAGPLGGFHVAIPGVLKVDEPSDIDDGNTSAGHLSLREALRLTNAAVGTSDTITFDPAVFGSPRTLTLTAGQFTVTDSVAIVGPGSGLLTLNAGGACRHFFGTLAGTGSLLSLSGLTLTSGLVNDDGGAIFNNTGRLDLSDVVISNCQASNAGGAIFAVGSLTMRDCTVSNNTDAGSGGGIYVSVSGSVYGGGAVVIERSSIVNNQAGGAGGGLDINSYGALQISDSVIAGNQADRQSATYGGGGIFVGGAIGSGSFIRNSTISGNVAANGSPGGGLSLVTYDTLPIANSTITGNSTTGSGGGIAVTAGYYGGVGNVTLNSTIISGNSAGSAADMNFPVAISVSGDNNLIGVANAGNFTLIGAGNKTGAVAVPLNPMLAPLANNGGPTKSHALLPGSPALNAGNNAAGLTTDQRGLGFLRVVGSAADIGAFEVQTAPVVQSVGVNDGSAQRSEVKSISVTFSTAVTFGGGNAVAAFQLQHLTDGAHVVLIAAVSSDTAGDTVVTLTFSGPETDPVSALNGGPASLADGRYRLTILSTMVSANGEVLNGGGPNGDYVSPTDTYQGNGLHLYRLFGDVSGDGVVDSADLGQFRSTFNRNSTDPLYLAFLDANGDGVVDSTDLGQFRSRFNVNVF